MKEVILKLTNIGKTFSGVNVLRDIDLEIHTGEIHCLIGENGAGKSTLIKILSGYHKPDKGGEIIISGKPVEFKEPKDAINASISTIYQELTLCPLMTVAENICLNIQDSFKGVLQQKKEYVRIARETLARIGHSEIDPNMRVGQLSIAKQQLVEIARALVSHAKIILMDEPTSSIAIQDIESLFKLIKELREQGVAIIYISHKLTEIAELADRVTVLRDGDMVGTLMRDELETDKIVSMMVGRKLENAYPKADAELGDVVLEVEGLCSRYFKDVNFSVRQGEIFGITGLVGARRTEIFDALFGRLPITGGTVKLFGEAYTPKTPQAAIKQGIAYITEDRRKSGLVLCRPVDENINLISIQEKRPLGAVDRAKFKRTANEQVSNVDIRLNSVKQLAGTLSGGNQQKTVIGKWMTAAPKIVLFDEPTRGIDIKAKSGIYELIGRMVTAGITIIMVSSELPELMSVSDRILVMCEGKQKAILETAQTSQEEIMQYAMP